MTLCLEKMKKNTCGTMLTTPFGKLKLEPTRILEVETKVSDLHLKKSIK